MGRAGGLEVGAQRAPRLLVCNIVINWAEPPLPIRDYVIYEQPLTVNVFGMSVSDFSCVKCLIFAFSRAVSDCGRGGAKKAAARGH